MSTFLHIAGVIAGAILSVIKIAGKAISVAAKAVALPAKIVSTVAGKLKLSEAATAKAIMATKLVTAFAVAKAGDKVLQKMPTAVAVPIRELGRITIYKSLI